jgi:hypothetical protein
MTALAGSAAILSAAQAADKKPNILVIMGHDVGYSSGAFKYRVNMIGPRIELGINF